MLRLTSDVRIGIEIGTQRILIAELRKKAGRYTLQRVAQVAIPSEVIADGKIIQVETLAEVLRDTMRAANMSSKKVNLAVSSQYVLIRQLQLPDLPVKQLRKVIDFELQTSIHLPFEDPLFDFVKLDRVAAAAGAPDDADIALAAMQEVAAAGEAAPCEVMLIATTRTVVNPLLEVARRASLKPQSVDIRALALSRACQKLGIDMAGQTTMFIDVAETSTDIHIFHGELLQFTRNVPIELGNYQLDRERGKPLHVLAILEYFQQNTDYRSFAYDLAYEIERSMNFFRYTLNNRDAALTRIVLTGLLPHAGMQDQYLTERFPGISIGTMTFDRLDIGPDAETVAGRLCEYAVPIGLALKEV